MYYVICKKNAENKNYSVRRTEQNRLMLSKTLLFEARKKQGLLKIKKLVN